MNHYAAIVRNKSTNKAVASFHGDTLAEVQAKYDRYKLTQVDHKLSGLKVEVARRVSRDLGGGPEWYVVSSRGGNVQPMD